MLDPFNEIRKLQKEMNKLFNRFFKYPKSNEESLYNKEDYKVFRGPLSNLKETENELIASIELPGVDKKDIQLIVKEDNLEVNIEKRAEMKIKKRGYVREERSYKGFHRKISLPFKVIPEEVESSYKNGILEIIMPKAEKKRLRKIEIR